jgi:hypothetical protein
LKKECEVGKPANGDLVKKMAKMLGLKELLDGGVLTQEEFDTSIPTESAIAVGTHSRRSPRATALHCAQRTAATAIELDKPIVGHPKAQMPPLPEAAPQAPSFYKELKGTCVAHQQTNHT